MLSRFNSANHAFEYMFSLVMHYGRRTSKTKALSNIGFYLDDPMNNDITCKWRKWNKDYAEYEWNWYLSQNRSVEELKLKAKIWDTMHDGDNIVNSNYGWQWNRNGQLGYVINELKRDKETRRAVLSIYDGKEHESYKYDTPCTLSIMFNIIDDKLCMTVNMRSNDLIYGFCNDQYCFSKLQEIVAKEVGLPIGWYFHFVNDLHIYEKHFKLNERVTTSI